MLNRVLNRMLNRIVDFYYMKNDPTIWKSPTICGTVY
jgi:hypothetical protein